MQVHIPKPLHGWREFAGEVGVIVLGVLIALGAEQLVQAMHERSIANEAREDVRRELARDLAYLSTREATEPCLKRRFLELQTIIGNAKPDGTFPRPRWVGRPQFWSLETVRWDAAAQGRRAALLPPNEMAHYSSIYTQLRIAIAEMATEQGDWARLRSLEWQPKLPPQAVYDLGLILNDARYRAWRIALITKQELHEGAAMKLPVERNDVPASQSICVPITATRAEGQRLSRMPFGEP